MVVEGLQVCISKPFMLSLVVGIHPVLLVRRLIKRAIWHMWRTNNLGCGAHWKVSFSSAGLGSDPFT